MPDAHRNPSLARTRLPHRTAAHSTRTRPETTGHLHWERRARHATHVGVRSGTRKDGLPVRVPFFLPRVAFLAHVNQVRTLHSDEAEIVRVESRRQTTFTPGFYKIFDEILVNAADNKVSRDRLGVLAVEPWY